MIAADKMVSAATATITTTTPRTKALRTTSSVTSSRAIAVPLHHSNNMKIADSPNAAAARRSPERTWPTGNQPAPMLSPASTSTDTALRPRPMIPRRFSEKRMV